MNWTTLSVFVLLTTVIAEQTSVTDGLGDRREIRLLVASGHSTYLERVHPEGVEVFRYTVVRQDDLQFVSLVASIEAEDGRMLQAAQMLLLEYTTPMLVVDTGGTLPVLVDLVRGQRAVLDAHLIAETLRFRLDEQAGGVADLGSPPIAPWDNWCAIVVAAAGISVPEGCAVTCSTNEGCIVITVTCQVDDEVICTKDYSICEPGTVTGGDCLCIEDDDGILNDVSEQYCQIVY